MECDPVIYKVCFHVHEGNHSNSKARRFCDHLFCSTPVLVIDCVNMKTVVKVLLHSNRQSAMVIKVSCLGNKNKC